MVLSTKSNHVSLKGFDKVKYELNKYHAERYWGIFVASIANLVLDFRLSLDAACRIRLCFTTVPKHSHSGSYCWTMVLDARRSWHSQNANDTNVNTNNNQLYVKAGETVKFVARLIDVNHGFGVLSSQTKWMFPYSRCRWFQDLITYFITHLKNLEFTQ